MKSNKIAMFLSALIFPGLGQVYKHDLKKGIILVGSATLCLSVLFLGGLILLNYEYAAIYPKPLDKELLEEIFFRILRHPLVLFFLGLLIGVWGYAIVDAGRSIASADAKEG
jgi:protein-S-isoprenylcysteine O-methyltransferase Ste14